MLEIQRKTEMDDKYFILYSCCIPVKGARKSIICDLQRGKIVSIPNDLYYILQQVKSESINNIKEKFIEETKTIEQYINFLYEKDLGFYCDDTLYFPDLNLSWDRPAVITNAIIDVDNKSNHPYEKIFEELNDLNCEALQIRFYSHFNIKEINNILFYATESLLSSINLIIKFDVDYKNEEIKHLCENNPRITYIYFHSTPSDIKLSKNAPLKYGNAYITFLSEEILTHHQCGNISPSYFICNIPMFTESQNYNSCLNRKISIDVDGNVKNCPSMNKFYGNIRNITLRDVLNESDFKDIWFIKKDDIDVCKDCEYRYICTDCRAYIHDENNIYSKPKKCQYNPYLATWN